MTKKRVFDIIQVGNATDIPSRIFDMAFMYACRNPSLRDESRDMILLDSDVMPMLDLYIPFALVGISSSP